MLQIGEEAANPSICNGLRQPRMVCDWQEDRHESQNNFYKFSKLPSALKSIGRDYSSYPTWEIRAEGTGKLSGTRHFGHIQSSVVSFCCEHYLSAGSHLATRMLS